MRGCSTAPVRAGAGIAEDILSTNNGAYAAGVMSAFAAFFFLDFEDYLYDLQKGPWEVVLPEAQVSERKPLLSGAPTILLHRIWPTLRQPGLHFSVPSSENLPAKLTIHQCTTPEK
jgi:hypothetical protein